MEWPAGVTTHRDRNVDGERVSVDADDLGEGERGGTGPPPKQSPEEGGGQPPVAEDGGGGERHCETQTHAGHNTRHQSCVE